MKRLLILIFLLQASCTNEKASTYEDNSASEDSALHPDAEFYFLREWQSGDKAGVLYYEPISGKYYGGELSQTNISASNLALSPITEEKYLYIKPQKRKYQPVASDKLHIFYKQQDLIFKQELKLLKLRREQAEENQNTSYSVYPISGKAYGLNDEFLMTDFYRIYSLNPDGVLSEEYTLNDEGRERLAQSYPIFIPLKLTNENEKLGALLAKLNERSGPYTDFEIWKTENFPLLLAVFANNPPDSYNYKEDREIYEEVLPYVLEYYRAEITADFVNFFGILNDSTIPTFLKIFKDEASLHAEELYTKSLENSDVWEQYALEMPKFQELLKADIPLPKDFKIKSYDYDSKKPETTNMLFPPVHYFALRGFFSPLKLLIEKYPDTDLSVTNFRGLSIFQEVIKSGEYYVLMSLFNLVTNFNPHELTPSNETWLDLAYQLPLYNFYLAEDNVESEFLKVREEIITNIAPKYNITNNIPLVLKLEFNPAQPRSLASLQAKYLEIDKDFIPILPHTLRKEHRYLFEENIPKDFDLRPLINFDPDEYHRYERETGKTYERLVRFLVDVAEVDYQKIDANGDNLLLDVLFGSSMSLFEYFVDKGLSPLYKDNRGQTLLHKVLPAQDDNFTASYAHFAEPLLKMGVDVNAIDQYGYTAYSRYWAGACAWEKTLELLIKYGAKTNIGKFDEKPDMCVG